MSAPPRLALRLLRRILPEAVGDYLVGDLIERHAAMARRSRIRADLWFWRQTIVTLLVRLPGPLGVEPGGVLRALRTDVGTAVRGLIRRPGSSVTAVLALALGIGVVGTAFSIVHGTVLRGLPFEEADRLVHFERADHAAGRPSMAVTPHDYKAWREVQSTFDDLGAYVEAAAVFPVDGGPPERHLGVRISRNSFELLRVRPMLGRLFAVDEERPDGPAVVVLSHALWSARFAADPAIVGTEIRMNGVPTTVVGVMPEGFGFPIAERFWLPLRLDLSAVERGQGRLDVFGRLHDGVAFETAVADFTAITARLAEAYPETNRGVTAELRTFHDEYVGEEFTRTIVRMLVGSLLLLLVCCANVANLLLVRGVRRRRAFALRVSLGATRGRIVAQLVTEAVVLAGVGAVVGVGIAFVGVEWFDRVGARAGVFDLPHGSDSLFWWDVGLDATAMLVVVATAVLAALLAGVLPALSTSRVASRGVLGARSGSASFGRAAKRFSDGLVVVQLALATGLLVIAGLVTRSGLNVAAAADTFSSEGVWVTTVDLPFDGGVYTDDPRRLALAETLVERIASEPGVEAVALGTALPLTLPHAVPFAVEGRETVAADGEVGVVSISRDYFDLLGVAPEEGRDFEPTDRAGGAPVAVVNRSFVTRYLAGRSPLGARVRLADEPWVTVIGVVHDLWDRPLQPEREAGIYLPLAQSGDGDAAVRLGRLGLRNQTLLVRSRAPSEGPADVVRRAVHAVDGSLPVRTVESMEAVVSRRMGRYRVWGRFYLVFATAGLLLAGLGVYGVLAFSVAQRTSEIGVRRALGASSGSVQRRVLGGAGRQVALGSIIGLAVGAGLADGIGRVLYGVDTSDPRTFVVVAIAMSWVGLLASWLPARRAAHVDPIEAIRSE